MGDKLCRVLSHICAHVRTYVLNCPKGWEDKRLSITKLMNCVPSGRSEELLDSFDVNFRWVFPEEEEEIPVRETSTTTATTILFKLDVLCDVTKKGKNRPALITQSVRPDRQTARRINSPFEGFLADRTCVPEILNETKERMRKASSLLLSENFFVRPVPPSHNNRQKTFSIDHCLWREKEREAIFRQNGIAYSDRSRMQQPWLYRYVRMCERSWMEHKREIEKRRRRRRKRRRRDDVIKIDPI